MKKKRRGLKRKWVAMLLNLNQMAENETKELDEIFIAESFDDAPKKKNTDHRKELVETLGGILQKKVAAQNGRYYLLWCSPDEIFESVILIFDSLDQVKEFFRQKNLQNKADEFSLKRKEKERPKQYKFLKDIAEKENYLIFSGKFGNQKEQPIVLISNEEMLEIAQAEFDE